MYIYFQFLNTLNPKWSTKNVYREPCNFSSGSTFISPQINQFLPQKAKSFSSSSHPRKEKWQTSIIVACTPKGYDLFGLFSLVPGVPHLIDCRAHQDACYCYDVALEAKQRRKILDMACGYKKGIRMPLKACAYRKQGMIHLLRGFARGQF